MLTALANRFPLFKGLLDFAFPPLCSGCEAYCDDTGGVCEQCQSRIDWYQRPFCLTCGAFVESDRGCTACGERSFLLCAGGNYASPLKDIIIRLKFRGAVSPVGFLAGRLAELFGERINKLAPDVLVPIPLHPGREYSRGYNQASLLAEKLSCLISVPVDETIIFRVKKRRPQASLKAWQRAENIRGVFTVSGERDLVDRTRRVMLVDDVVTSGSTVREAAEVLRKVGYRVVGAVAVAHGA